MYQNCLIGEIDGFANSIKKEGNSSFEYGTIGFYSIF